MDRFRRERDAKRFAATFDDGDWPVIKEPLTQPSDLCGSQREHEPHEWTGQTTGKKLNCPGYPIPTSNRPPVGARGIQFPPAKPVPGVRSL